MKFATLLSLFGVSSAGESGLVMNRQPVWKTTTNIQPGSSLMDCRDGCGEGEVCGYWVHNNDDREQCINEQNCNTFGRMATSGTRDDVQRERFVWNCQSMEDAYAIRENLNLDKYEEALKNQGAEDFQLHFFKYSPETQKLSFLGEERWNWWSDVEVNVPWTDIDFVDAGLNELYMMLV